MLDRGVISEEEAINKICNRNTEDSKEALIRIWRESPFEGQF